MRYLIFKIYALLQLMPFRALLLVMLLTVSVFAQGTGNSVVIINTTPANGAAGQVAHWAEAKIGAGLLDKFPCVDFASTGDIAAILGQERRKELLGGEETSPEQWQNLAGAIGARYIVVVSVTVLPNGRTVVSAKVLDANTASAIANEMETGANAEAALDNAESVAKKLMQTFSGIFKNKCEPHWTGTISFVWKREWEDNKTTFNRMGGMGKDITTNVSQYMRYSKVIEAHLQPMTHGFEGTNKTMALVVRRFEKHDGYIRKQTFTVTCRAPGQKTRWRDTNAENSEIRDETGEKTATMPVWIHLIPTQGRFEINVRYPALTTRWQEENKNAPAGGCANPEPSIVILKGEREEEDGTEYVKGQIDPKNPDTLIGEETRGDLEVTGQWTIKWNLRLVKPKTKK